MRLWHYDLISVLPKGQLVSQWRECLAMKRGWENGTLNHGLVNYIKQYDTYLFSDYALLVAKEMQRRGIRFQSKFVNEFVKFSKRTNFDLYEHYPEHNDRYLRECLYNLEEKAMRGMIPKQEWQKIYEKYKNRFDLWYENSAHSHED